MLFLECTTYSLFFLFFLLAQIHNAFSTEEANIIYIAFIALTFGYLYVFEFFFRKHDIAVHWKMFKRFYQPTGKKPDPSEHKRKGLAGVAASWALYLLAVGYVKHIGILTWQVFLMGACVMFIFNSFFTRKTCLLSVLFLKNHNHCCKNCGINSWDYLIFSTALFFAPELSVTATVMNYLIIIISFVTFVFWEYMYHKYPERFYPGTNKALWCVYCEKQCRNRYRGSDQSSVNNPAVKA